MAETLLVLLEAVPVTSGAVDPGVVVVNLRCVCHSGLFVLLQTLTGLLITALGTRAPLSLSLKLPQSKCSHHTAFL